MKNLLAIIGGTGVTQLHGLQISRRKVVKTPHGNPSGPLMYGEYAGCPVIFLARHGYGHTIPPHQINYRANIWALRHSGVGTIVSIAATGAINAAMRPCDLVIPHQLIDYTYGREQTFFEKGLVTHADFTGPYCQTLRDKMLKAAAQCGGITVHSQGVYGVTQGPRLETAAEIDRMERDGCDLVGMTGMPEAGLARELNLCYATCAIVANKAAGRGSSKIKLEDIKTNLEYSVTHLHDMLSRLIPSICQQPVTTQE